MHIIINALFFSLLHKLSVVFIWPYQESPRVVMHCLPSLSIPRLMATEISRHPRLMKNMRNVWTQARRVETSIKTQSLRRTCVKDENVTLELIVQILEPSLGFFAYMSPNGRYRNYHEQFQGISNESNYNLKKIYSCENFPANSRTFSCHWKTLGQCS